MVESFVQHVVVSTPRGGRSHSLATFRTLLCEQKQQKINGKGAMINLRKHVAVSDPLCRDQR